MVFSASQSVSCGGHSDLSRRSFVGLSLFVFVFVFVVFVVFVVVVVVEVIFGVCCCYGCGCAIGDDSDRVVRSAGLVFVVVDHKIDASGSKLRKRFLRISDGEIFVVLVVLRPLDDEGSKVKRCPPK